MDDEGRAARITTVMDRIRGRFEELGDDEDDWEDAREARNLVVWSLTAALIAKLPDYRDVIAALREEAVSALVMGPYQEGRPGGGATGDRLDGRSHRNHGPRGRQGWRWGVVAGGLLGTEDVGGPKEGQRPQDIRCCHGTEKLAPAGCDG